MGHLAVVQSPPGAAWLCTVWSWGHCVGSQLLMELNFRCVASVEGEQPSLCSLEAVTHRRSCPYSINTSQPSFSNLEGGSILPEKKYPDVTPGLAPLGRDQVIARLRQMVDMQLSMHHTAVLFGGLLPC